MDSTTLTADKVELATISRDETDGGRVSSLPYPTSVRRWERKTSQRVQTPAFIVFAPCAILSLRPMLRAASRAFALRYARRAVALAVGQFNFTDLASAVALRRWCTRCTMPACCSRCWMW